MSNDRFSIFTTQCWIARPWCRMQQAALQCPIGDPACRSLLSPPACRLPSPLLSSSPPLNAGWPCCHPSARMHQQGAGQQEQQGRGHHHINNFLALKNLSPSKIEHNAFHLCDSSIMRTPSIISPSLSNYQLPVSSQLYYICSIREPEWESLGVRWKRLMLSITGLCVRLGLGWNTKTSANISMRESDTERKNYTERKN